MRLTPVMLALLLVLSPVAVALQASSPSAPTTAPAERSDTIRPGENRNTTAVLMLGTDPMRTSFEAPSMSLGSSLAMNRNEFQTELSVATLDQHLSTAKTAEKKKQALNRYRYRIENRIISLKAREQEATQSFSNGSLSTAKYVRTLGAIDREAGEVRDAINAMQTRASRVPKFGFTASEAKSLKAKLVPIEGPIRNRVAKTMQGRAEPTRLYVSTAKTGIVLSAIIDGQYVRETYRSDNRDPSKSGSMRVEVAEDQIIQPQYPWVINNSPGGNHWHYSSLNAIRYTYHHYHGNLTAYVDTGTERIYREIQYKQLNSGFTEFVYNASENVTLLVNRTYPGGPLRVKLTNSTGSPLDGRVRVAGHEVGRTHGDGIVWALGPAERFEVSATYEDTTVNATVRPITGNSSGS